MSKHTRLFIASFTLSVVILACALPQIPPIGQPAPGGNTSAPPASPNPNEVGTVVAMTLTALAPPVLTPTAAATAPENVPTTLLPHSFYYLAPDSAGLTQIYRIETDGTTRRQITAESVSVIDFDVSLVDGSVAYISDNQLLYVSAFGSERRVITDGETVDPNNPFISTVSNPVFSPDGQTLAYGLKGLQIYSFITDKSRLVIKNQIEAVGDGLFVPRELYSPERYSPDGTKLLVTLGYYEGASSAIYDPATEGLLRLNGGEGALICCEDTEWSSDGASVYAANPSMGVFSSGLWKVDPTTGDVATLIPGDAGGGSYNSADEAYLASDGRLYFFFTTFTDLNVRPPLQLVRSAPDGVSGRTVLSEQDFQLLNEALWAPDGSLVIAVIAPSPENYRGGQAEIVYPDGRDSLVLTPYVQQMKWGP